MVFGFGGYAQLHVIRVADELKALLSDDVSKWKEENEWKGTAQRTLGDTL